MVRYPEIHFFGPQKARNWEQDGKHGQTDAYEMNGECRKQNWTPRRFQ